MYNIPVKHSYRYDQYHMIYAHMHKIPPKFTNVRKSEINVNLTTGHIIKLISTSETCHYNQQ